MTNLPNILVLSFRPKKFKHDGLERLRTMLAPYAKLFVVSISDEYQALPTPQEILRYADGMFVFGSSDLFFDGQKEEIDPIKQHTRVIVESLKPLVSHVVERDFPTFAFCFGHQLIAHCMGSPIVASSFTGKVGTYEVELTRQGIVDPLFALCPEKFSAHYGHRDIVAIRPEASTLLAHGRLCHNAMLRYATRVYTSQFHPELDGNLVKEYLGSHESYSENVVAHSDIADTPHAESLPIRFVEMLRETAQKR